MDWPYHPPRVLHHQNRFALDTRGKTKKAPPEVKTTWRPTVEKEINRADREDLETMLLLYMPPGVKGMSE